MPLFACSEEPAAGTPDGDAADQGTPPSSDGNGPSSGGGNTDQPTTDVDPGEFQAQHGYPLDFAVCFTMDGVGFDTRTNSLLNGSNTVSYTFTAEDFTDLYRCLDNTNFWSIPLNLTYSKLTGTSAAEGPGVQYVISITTWEGTRTCYVDGAALNLLSADPAVSNVKSLVTGLLDCLSLYSERAAA